MFAIHNLLFHVLDIPCSPEMTSALLARISGMSDTYLRNKSDEVKYGEVLLHSIRLEDLVTVQSRGSQCGRSF